MKPIPENKKAVYHAWMSLDEAKRFAEWGGITLEEEIKRLNDMGFAVVDFDDNNNKSCTQ
jgi:hypothetical protein